MHMQHIERLVIQHLNRPQRSRWIGSERGNGSIRRKRQRVAQRCDETCRWRTIARPEHPRLVAARTQLVGKCHHLHLHAARDRQAVRTDQADAQRPIRLVVDTRLHSAMSS